MVIEYRAVLKETAEAIKELKGRDYQEVRCTSGYEKDDMLHNLYNTMYDYLRHVGSTLISPELQSLIFTTLRCSGSATAEASNRALVDWLYNVN
jgi:hypothetical protein